jgi:hypothetical protein
MKRNLLDYTQSILSALNSDQVNSISDTSESMQVAEILRSKYYDILGRAELPEHEKLFQLTASGDITKPTLMYRPNEGIAKLDWIQYYNSNLLGSDTGEQQTTHDLNVDIVDNDEFQDQFGSVSAPAYQYVQILPVSDLLGMINTLDTTQSNVGSFSLVDVLVPGAEVPDTIQHINYRNDKQPQYCCVIQNYYFIFDSYDNTQDSTLQTNKTLCKGFITPNWIMSDTFVPDIDDWAVPLLYNEAKAQAFYELKQTVHPMAEREIDRQWVALQKTKAVVNKPSWFDQLPNFGRRKWWP